MSVVGPDFHAVAVDEGDFGGGGDKGEGFNGAVGMGGYWIGAGEFFEEAIGGGAGAAGGEGESE